MHRIAACLLLPIATAAHLSGCAMVVSPVTGGIVTNVGGPASATSNEQSAPKVGKATASSVLGLFASGDASIEAAMKAGGITEIHHVDYESHSVLGIYATYTVLVYGQGTEEGTGSRYPILPNAGEVVVGGASAALILNGLWSFLGYVF